MLHRKPDHSDYALHETPEELVQDLFVSLWTKRHGAIIRVLRPYLLIAAGLSDQPVRLSDHTHARYEILDGQVVIDSRGCTPDRKPIAPF